ncbi:MAG: cytochrome c biogenesis protein ResB [Gammaproteobacteria bacterium]|nr:cytochrome c biogenesis protein ResB [Gammaproteobacteria bacterium]
MSETIKRGKPRRGLTVVLMEFLGSMNLAITLLVALAIASVIGTVLQQNQPYNNYVMKFGPFWFEVFKSLSLFDIYGAPWFLILLGFLLLSTSVCVYRNAPSIIKDMRHFRLDVQDKSLRGFHHSDEWHSIYDPKKSVSELGKRLSGLGYRVRVKQHPGHMTLAAMKGSVSRLGYLLSHVGIVVICIGGLLDGNLPLKWAEWRGDIAIETRDIPVSEIADKSILSPDSSSFRGSVNIPEGSSANFIFLGMRDGYLVQKLPFTVELEDFRIEHYPSGMPKSFESTIVIHDDELDEPLKKDIAVNHPLIYKGHAIYQASFADGGSKVALGAWSLDTPLREPLQIDGTIGTDVKLNTPRGSYTLELTDFKRFNIFPLSQNDPSGKKFQNYGPSIVLKLRAANGEAREYVNYMTPIMVDGRPFLLSGMRASPAEEYRFLHLPVDKEGGIERFLRLLALAQDEERVRAIAQHQAELELGMPRGEEAHTRFSEAMVGLLQTFLDEGIDAIVDHTEKSVPEEKREEALSSFIRIIQGILGGLYLELLAEEGVDTSSGVSAEDGRYFDDAVNAISLLGPYGSPLYLKLEDFQHIEASGFQITKAPGQNIVYLGCVMLMLGVFFMFYLHYRRLWLLVSEDEKGAKVLFAATTHRERGNFDNEFEFLRQELRYLSGAALSRIE